MLIFVEWGKPKIADKTRTINKLNPQMTQGKKQIQAARVGGNCQWWIQTLS